MFLILLKYTKPVSEIEQLTAGHRDFLDKYYAAGQLIVSGRRMDQTGGVILANMASHGEVERMLANDPFRQAGAAEYEIIDFHPSKYANDFGPFLHVPLSSGDIRPGTAGGTDDVAGQAR